MSIATWTWGVMLVVAGAATAACGAPADGNERTEESEAADTKGGGTTSQVGQPCHVTSGGNAGKSGTYTNDVDGLNCAGPWGSSNCDTGKCANGAAIISFPRPPIAPIGPILGKEQAVEKDQLRIGGGGGGGTPFCLPGEKVVCTLGPPPVCHCEPEAFPIEGYR